MAKVRCRSGLEPMTPSWTKYFFIGSSLFIHLQVTLRPSEMLVKVGDETKISGKLWNILDGDSMTWTIQNGRKLEITACKAHEGLVWKRFLIDETVEDGEEVMDPAMVEKIHEEVCYRNNLY